MKKILDRAIETVFKISSAITSITILLIIVFLFKEGLGLFQSLNIEKGYVLVVDAKNPVDQLQPVQIKEIFDSQIHNWKTVGGNDESIYIFRISQIIEMYGEKNLGNEYEVLPQKISEIIQKKPGAIVYVPQKYAPKDPTLVKELRTKNIQLSDFLLGKEWLPTATPSSLFGILPLLLGTLLVCFVAILIAVPFGLGVAVYLAEIAGERMRKFLKPTINLLAGIPSVVYGFFGLVVLAPIVQKVGSFSLGETAFTGSLILAIMALPTIIMISEDAMRNTPIAMREASYALGANQWQTIYKVIIPYASSGISTAIILGIGRAIGETMAVLMVTGNAAVIPHSIFESVRTIPATIAAELGEAPAGGSHYQSLFLLGSVLFIITMIINSISNAVSHKKLIKE